jgi:hypothetical protein
MEQNGTKFGGVIWFYWRDEKDAASVPIAQKTYGKPRYTARSIRFIAY